MEVGMDVDISDCERVKLSKTVLLSLPCGSLLISNVCDETGGPIFVATVDSQRSREELWAEVRRHRLAGTLFHVSRQPRF